MKWASLPLHLLSTLGFLIQWTVTTTWMSTSDLVLRPSYPYSGWSLASGSSKHSCYTDYVWYGCENTWGDTGISQFVLAFNMFLVSCPSYWQSAHCLFRASGCDFVYCNKVGPISYLLVLHSLVATLLVNPSYNCNKCFKFCMRSNFFESSFKAENYPFFAMCRHQLQTWRLSLKLSVCWTQWLRYLLVAWESSLPAVRQFTFFNAPGQLEGHCLLWQWPPPRQWQSVPVKALTLFHSALTFGQPA